MGIGNIAAMGPAADATGNDRRRVLGCLACARGYTVFDRRRRRVGTFIELAAAGGEGIAIRHDGVFFWRRRVLPLATVGAVFPEYGAVVLNVDRRTLKGTNAAATPVGTITPSPAEDECSDENRPAPIARGVAPSEGDSGAGGSAESTAQAHLLFVSTSHGYQLLERRGPAPGAFEYVSVPEHDGLFQVTKLATSPLPNDRRLCAYLERTS
jgi:hypothetical protein